MAPYTKQQLLNLVDTYIPAIGTEEFPNIRASEHRDLESKILDRVDGRILKTGTLSITNLNTYTVRTVVFSPPVYTNKYVVMLTPVTPPTHRVSYTITGRTTSQFTILIQPNYGAYNARFWYAVFSKEPL